MTLSNADQIAENVKSELAPYCYRIEIAGSIRRRRPEVKDIEIVAIPKPYETGLFENGIAAIVNRWEKVRGELPCKYTQRILPEGIALDLFFADQDNWGLIYSIRTGSADFSHRVLATGWVKAGYRSEDGYLVLDGRRISVPEEKDLFERIGIPFIEPELREVS